MTDDTAILYRCAIALKLSSLWKSAALDIANKIAGSLAGSYQDTANEEAGKKDTGKTLDLLSTLPCLAVTTSSSDLATPNQAGLDFSVEVVSPGWIQFRLTDRGLATWLQQLIQISPLLSDWEDYSSIGLQRKGEPGDRDSKIKKRYSQELEITHPGRLSERSKTAQTLFQVQYAHARCCSLLRLAHREGLIELSDLECKAPSWQWVKPNPIPWMFDDLEMEGEPRRLRLGHPAERGLIAQLLEGTDRISSLTPASAIKLAHALSKAFETFYSACRIWGEVKTETPQLAQARLGLVAVTQKLLRSLLEDQLGVTAPPEL
ncbi:DALR anticodon-binding domain-containing protein [Allocoleopsis sp.]|uniref:DALR anticodon-binding domain-containing protein n=1 Tax=Allocoleopsis sp. TaxID=3088169 RepID=UPI002FD29FD4